MLSAREIDTATRTLYGEARGEPYEGQVAVVWTFLNRLSDSRWPDDLEGVCLQPKQFSCWLASDPNRAKMLGLTDQDPEYVKLRLVVKKVMNGEIDDPTGGSNHYLVRGTPASWAVGRVPSYAVGAHDFFRL